MKVKRDGRPLVGWQALEGKPQCERGVRRGGAVVDRANRDLPWAAEEAGQGRATSPVQANGLAHHDPVEPWSQCLGITKTVALSPGLLERDLDRITRLTAVQADQARQADKTTVVLADEGIEACGIECQACPRDGVPSSVRGQCPRSVLLALNHRGMREAFRVNLRR